MSINPSASLALTLLDERKDLASGPSMSEILCIPVVTTAHADWLLWPIFGLCGRKAFYLKGPLSDLKQTADNVWHELYDPVRQGMSFRWIG